MSSAEDKTSSTVFPSQGSSNSAPEEFPLDSRQEHAPEHGDERISSVGPAGESPQVELKTNPSLEHSPEEPGDESGIALKTKPLPRGNAAAREIRVRVTGARSVSGERELFSELASTVLVFEKGGVIRLTAAVAHGQLLFLTNEESKREVVTQVMRKRVYRPTECYVEFEFTEPAPGFWGLEFSAATPLLPKDAKEVAAVELIASSETTEDEPDAATPPHSAEEVEALKREVEALRSQLGQLQTQPEPAQTQPAVAISKSPSMPPVDTRPPQSDAPSYQSEKAPWTELSADVAPIEADAKPSRVHSQDQELPSKPALVFRKSMLPPKRSFRARGELTPGFRTGMLRLAILSGVLAALIGFVWYKGWLPWMHQTTKFSVSTFAAGVTTKVAPETSMADPGSLATARANTGVNNTLSAKGTTPGSLGESPAEVASGNENASGAYEVVQKPATKETSRPPASTQKISPVRSVPVKESLTKTVAVVPSLPLHGGFVPPKLVQSERAVASLDDLHDFETGSVIIDAVIDTTGNVTSATVLSGPPSLRKPALAALKNYKYVPAVQNGQPVPAHVSIKIQFHFE